MGEVYRARDTRLGRDVAVKVLSDELADDPKALARFQAEARAVAALSHPNILALHDVGEEGGVRYAVTELLEGETLRTPLTQGALPLRRALEIAGQIADGLAAAHGKGIVHRDLKPENVFLTKDGHAKILDFGLARQRAPLPSSGETNSPTFSVLTDPGTVLGTFAYMSPEQASGKPVDHCSDQFSLGVVLYEMLTGKRPFGGATAAETLTAVIRDEPEPLEAGAPRVPAPVRWLVDRLLAKDPYGRYESTRDLARELKTLSLRLSEGAVPTGSARKSELRGRGWRRLVLPAGLVVLAAVAGAAVGVVLGRGPFARSFPEPPTFRPLTFSGQDEHAAASPDGKTIVFASTREEVRRIWLKQIDSGSEVAVTEGPDDDSPRFSPDGTSILFTKRNGTDSALHRVATLGGAARRVVERGRDADWSPDGKKIVFLRGDAEVWTATSDGGEERSLASLGNDRLVTPRWSPDGRRIALILYPDATPVRGGLHVLDAATGEDSPVDLPPDAGRTFGIAWADRGKPSCTRPLNVSPRTTPAERGASLCSTSARRRPARWLGFPRSGRASTSRDEDGSS
ncbi:MAG: serine/threonine-protein kinase [Deltaproteobacteria bacterium]|nr:serine/threonine-protein kinase [Deltaproteobacteria bacterium]